MAARIKISKICHKGLLQIKILLDESNQPKELEKKTIKPEESSQLAAVSSARNRGKDYMPMTNYELQKEKLKRRTNG